MIKGIDVSHWQGTIDWNKVKAAGIEFAIIKAGGSDAGTYTDSKWEANYKGARLLVSLSALIFLSARTA
jgi:GH25 family lysozyme M1 (1,4-beta-N-acetylmuramidase)